MRRVKFSFKLKQDIFLLLIYVIAAGLLLGFSSGGFVVNFKQAGFSALSWLQSGIHSIGSFFSGTVNAIKELSDLREKYALLEKRLEDYEAMQRSSAEIIRENERLREILSLSETIQFRNIPAEIIGRDSSSLYSAITVNKGAKHGVKKDMPVISFQDSSFRLLVGKVVQVGPATCMIMPLYDFQCNVSSKIETSRFYGIVSGQGSRDASLVMRYVPKRAQDEIRIGDMIVTSGENSSYPPNIAVGTVAGVNANNYDNQLEIIVNPAIDFAKLETVFILDTSARQESVFQGQDAGAENPAFQEINAAGIAEW